jgi:hypothetical protein
MAFSFLYLAVRALLGALVRSRCGLGVKDIELLVLRHEPAISRRHVVRSKLGMADLALLAAAAVHLPLPQRAVHSAEAAPVGDPAVRSAAESTRRADPRPDSPHEAAQSPHRAKATAGCLSAPRPTTAASSRSSRRVSRTVFPGNFGVSPRRPPKRQSASVGSSRSERPLHGLPPSPTSSPITPRRLSGWLRAVLVRGSGFGLFCRRRLHYWNLVSAGQPPR